MRSPALRCSRVRVAPGAARSGFSLIEVMAAILILGVGLVGITEGITTAIRSTRDSEEQTAAALFAAGLLETLRAEGYLTDGTADGECPAGLTTCRWRRTISPTELDGLHDVSVVIENSRTGKQLCELRTLLFEVPSDTTIRDRDRQRERDASSRRRQAAGGRGS